MPNWCDTTYKCVGSAKEVAELNTILERMNQRKEPIHPNGFGTLWLGELVIELGFDWEKYRCRGEITDFNYDGEGLLTIYQNTAWCEQEGVRKAIQERFPTIKVYFREEESGCEVYYTNDLSGDWFPEKFLLDGEDVWEYFERLEELSKFLNDRYGLTTKADLEDIQMQLNEYVEGYEDEDFYLNLHEFQYVEV